ncbi:MAG: DUF4402 domain-containing protein [Alphaproteobacteria bacterium]|nr:DUF4402 domain-containing protein [Alphaproteobacteria bacterium]
MKKIIVMLAFLLVTLDTFAANLRHREYVGDNMVMATGKAYATIVEPVSASAMRNLDFGMLTTKESGKVTLDENNERTTTGPGLATSKPLCGIIKLKGPKSQMVNIDIPNSYIIGSANKNARFEPDITKGGESYNLGNGEVNLRVGGTLHLDKDGLELGTHKGVYVVQASY